MVMVVSLLVADYDDYDDDGYVVNEDKSSDFTCRQKLLNAHMEARQISAENAHKMEWQTDNTRFRALGDDGPCSHFQWYTGAHVGN